jgi:hypothetical protein
LREQGKEIQASGRSIFDRAAFRRSGKTVDWSHYGIPSYALKGKALAEA